MANSSDFNILTADYTSPLQISITVLNVILCLFIAVGNSLTLRAITKFRNLRHQSNVMIGSLAVADMWMGVVYTPINLIQIHIPLVLKLKYVCLSFMFVGHFASLSAIIFLSLLSLERFYAVQFPFFYHAHSGLKAAVIFNAAVFAVLTISLIPILTGVAIWYDDVECYAPTLLPTYYTRIIVGMALIPMVLGFAAFVRVSLLEFRFRKQIFDQAVASLRKQESIRTKLMLTAYFVSLCFWMPHLLYYFYDSISKADRNIYLFRVLSLLDLGNSAVNCFLYAWKNSKFRAAYKELLCLNSPVNILQTSTEETETNVRNSSIHTVVTVH